jgi:ABC-type uncharacterized transport system permease subunit
MMRKIEDVANRLTDQDWGWWPFLFLRPQKHETMTSRHVLKMSLFYGPFYSLILILPIIVLLLRSSKLIDLSLWIPIFAGFTVIYTVIFFIAYLFTFAYFWNLRADRLQNSE